MRPMKAGMGEDGGMGLWGIVHPPGPEIVTDPGHRTEERKRRKKEGETGGKKKFLKNAR